uniref:Uncharacterized protein n=1 Tax=Rhizophora mucronata TaxID=61149 RepID=A0A2P2PZ63_RHIMU
MLRIPSPLPILPSPKSLKNQLTIPVQGQCEETTYIKCKTTLATQLVA